MSPTEIVAALEKLEPPKSMDDYPGYASERDALIDAMQRAIADGERLTEAHRAGLERAVAHAEMAVRLLELRRDEIVTQRERARIARRRVAQHLRSNRPTQVDLNA